MKRSRVGDVVLAAGLMAAVVPAVLPIFDGGGVGVLLTVALLPGLVGIATPSRLPGCGSGRTPPPPRPSPCRHPVPSSPRRSWR